MVTLKTEELEEHVDRSLSLELHITDYFPKPPNKTLGSHWGSLVKEKNRAFEQVMAAYYSCVRRPTFDGKVKVEIIREWGHKQRALDNDNLHAAIKYLTDALRKPNEAEPKRRLGIIEDDNPALCELIATQRPGSKPKGMRRIARTIISIEGNESWETLGTRTVKR